MNRNDAELRYSNWVSMLIDIIKPKNLYLIGGRGTAKTQDIIAKRSIDVVYELPRGNFAFLADTYINAMTNIVPNLIQGWERQGFFEDRVSLGTRTPGHFVVGIEPPADFERPYTRASEYKHTISTFNGCLFMIKSIDRPSVNAGISTVHNFGDEAKFFKEEKLKKSIPTLRGDYLLYKDSPYFMGQTYATDMPNPSDGENDWILRMKENMDINQILAIFYKSLQVNEIEYELYQAKENNATEREINNIIIRLDREKLRLHKVRKDSTLFMIVSSLVNIDILTFEYLVTNLNSLQYEEFKTSILSLKPGLQIGNRFYAELKDKHLYEDGYNYDYYDQFGLTDNITQTSEGLKYINTNAPLEAGYDAGNMMSLVIGQEQDNGKVLRLLKDMYTLSPEWIPELGQQFVKFFANHKYKQLLLYYDRAANNYKDAKQDFASQVKHSIEFDRAGVPTGWNVVLMSRGQGDISPAEEYDLANQMMGEKNAELPKLLIDKWECPHLTSSLKMAPLGKSSRGQIIKVKTSEKLKDIKRLPLESTNMSDAFKYFICRKNYMRIAARKKSISVGLTA